MNLWDINLERETTVGLTLNGKTMSCISWSAVDMFTHLQSIPMKVLHLWTQTCLMSGKRSDPGSPHSPLQKKTPNRQVHYGRARDRVCRLLHVFLIFRSKKLHSNAAWFTDMPSTKSAKLASSQTVGVVRKAFHMARGLVPLGFKLWAFNYFPWRRLLTCTIWKLFLFFSQSSNAPFEHR